MYCQWLPAKGTGMQNLAGCQELLTKQFETWTMESPKMWRKRKGQGRNAVQRGHESDITAFEGQLLGNSIAGAEMLHMLC